MLLTPIEQPAERACMPTEEPAARSSMLIE
jgi:hypothetical protein